MLPELAAGYVAGWIPNAALTLGHFYFHKQKLKSEKMVRLQTNLRSIGWMWAESEGRLRRWVFGRDERDSRRYQRSVWLLGLAGLVLSWFGFLMQALVMISLRKLAVPRAETLLYESALTQKTLTPQEAQAELDRLSEQYPEAFFSVRAPDESAET